MAGGTIITSTTIGLTSLPNSITAQGNGVYDIVSNSTPYINITVGFVYSTSTMVVSANSPIVGLDTGSLISGIGISEIATPNLYPGGPSVAPFTSTDINVDYTLSITGILPNTNYNVRSYIKYYGSSGQGPFYKYGSQLSILSSSGVSGGSGYYISNDTVGFYDPLQVREANEGIERVLTSDSSGLATWKPVKSLFTFGHYIGERYGGGIVAAVWKEGDDEKVLIVSESDVPADTPTGSSYFPSWSYGVSRTTLIGAGAQSRYNGYLNTAAIVAQSISLGTTYSAAAGAAAYRGGGFEDWYLPSYYEFNQVFNNLAIVNKVLEKETIDLAKSAYWTSTEYNSTQAVQFSGWGGLASSTYQLTGKSSPARVRAVRKESVYTGDGLIFNLDATNKKSFSDIDYMNLGTASRWKDLVNGGIGLSYSFLPSYYPSASSGGTTAQLLTYLDTIGGTENLGYRQVGSWWIDKMSGFSTPIFYNRTGESHMTSVYFSVPLNGNANLQFACFDNSAVKDTVKAKLSIYVSIDSGAYILFKELDDITTTSTRNISLNAFLGKTISIKIKAPNAYYVSTTDYGGPTVDNISVSSTSGGYQATGPVYLPQESGFIRFNGTGSLVNEFSSYGSYFDIVAPVGNATTVTVEIWMRLKDGYQTRMPFAWSKYSIFTGAGGGLGFNTGVGDLFGIDSAKVQSLGIVENWTHFVFEMRSDVSYTNNKMYINGNEQVLSQVAGAEEQFYRNFNGGVGRIGGWRSPDNNKLYLFRGDISVVRIYNRPLTKDEIMKNYSIEKKRYEILPTLMRNSIVTSINFDDPTSYSGNGTISGIVSDISGNGVNASLVIKPTTTVPAVVRTNTLHNGKELVFTGDNATNPSLFWNTTTNNTNFLAFLGITSISISFWIKLGARRVADQDLILKWSDATGFIGPWSIYQSMALYDGSYINFRLWDGVSSSSYVSMLGNKRVDIGKWMHICATYNSITKKVRTYIDSAIDVDSSVPASYNLINDLGNIYVGGRPPVSYNSGSGTWVCPPGVTSITIECWGGGGGGGGANSQGAGGGGGGGYAKSTIAVVPGTTYYWSVGSGGAAGTAGPSGTSGGPGGSSWFNTANTVPTSLSGVLAGGGGGGGGQTNGAGGASGTGIYGTTIYSGGKGATGSNLAGNGGGGGGGAAGSLGNGSNGGSLASTTTPGVAGYGGGAGGAGGAYLLSGSNAGGNGAVPGGGGGGCFYFSTNNVAGGAGGSGMVLINFNNVDFIGSIANLQIYGKELSGGEVKNNYDVDKHRFDNFNDANKFYSHEINTNPTFSISQNFRLNIGDSFNEKIMKLDSVGYSKWVDKSSLFTRPTNYRYIGELYGGGIIVAMWYYPKTIFNYLIMSLEDVSAGSQWSNITNLASGATSEHRGDTNQTAILAQGGHTTSAAKICDDYTGGGYTDWYLPSVFEMNQAFNAAGIVDTVLGSDKLDGAYWTSTEPYQNGSDGAMVYSFLEAGTSTGIQSRASKTSTYKVRAFRMATNAVITNVWNPSWDETYTPWWGRGIDQNLYWEMDFMPASYTPFDFDYWRRTTASTGILTFFSQSGAAPNYTLTFKVTGSSVTSYENILEFGVCWTGVSSQNSPVFYVPTPTVNDNKVVSNSSSYSSFSSTIVWTGVAGIYSNLYGNLYQINVRAYAITASGNVYYGDLKYYPTQVNMV